MSTSALPRGSEARLRLARQTGGFSTQAASGFKELHFLAPFALEPIRPLGEDLTIGGGQQNDLDARPAEPGLPEARASGKVPLDLDQIGVFLTGLLGDDVAATGTNPNYVHTRKSGKATVPSYSMEMQHAADQFDVGVGMVVSALTFGLGPEGGYHSVDVEMIGRQAKDPAAVTAAGTPTVMALGQRVVKSIGRLSIGGTNVGSVLNGTMKIANGATLERYSGDELAGAAYVDRYTLELEFTARLQTAALLAHGVVGADKLPPALAVQQEYQVNANRGLLFDIAAMRFEPVSRPIEANGVRQVRLRGRAEVSAGAPMLVATLKNGQAGTVYA